METTNSSENPQRRVEDRKPNETINWEAPGAPAVPLSPAASERANPPIRYVASLLVNSEGASVFTTPDAARLPHGHYLLSAGTRSIAPDAAATSGDALTDLHDAIMNLPCKLPPSDEKVVPWGQRTASTRDSNDRLAMEQEIASWRELWARGLPYEMGHRDARHAAAELVLSARIERAAAPAPKPANLEDAPEGEQEWAKVDPATAFHLIERHAENWADAGRMMLAWREANPAPATASGDELPVERINEIGLGLRIQAFENAAYRAARGQAMTEPEKAEHAGLVAFARAAVSAATKPTVDAESAWKQYAAARTPLMDTSANRAIFAAGYSAAATRPTADLSKLARYGFCDEGVDFGEEEEGCYVKFADVQSLLATKPAAAPEVPEGFVLIPKRLTAENGAKGVLSGEFKESIEVPCPECADEDDEYECQTCEGFGRVSQDVPVS